MSTECCGQVRDTRFCPACGANLFAGERADLGNGVVCYGDTSDDLSHVCVEVENNDHQIEVLVWNAFDGKVEIEVRRVRGEDDYHWNTSIRVDGDGVVEIGQTDRNNHVQVYRP